jgi:hypothetical protein
MAGGGRWFIKHLPWIANNKFNPWYKQQGNARAPSSSFGEWYKSIGRENY